MEYVVDVSVHNGIIDWAKAKASGVKGAIIRCGYGRDFTKYDDPYYQRNMKGALDNGIKVGVYLYSYAKDDASAISEANHLLRMVEPYKEYLSLPVFYDVEENGTERGTAGRCKIFCDKVRSKGYKVGVYANLYWWENYLNTLDTTNIYIWLAKWGGSKPSHKLDIWQYDAYGKIPGIGSGVDLDRCFGELEAIINGTDPEPKQEVTEVEVKVLKKGMRGEAEVFAVQSILRAQGYKYEKKLIEADGNFGKITADCVAQFQKKNNLTVDSIVGKNTWNKLING